MILKTVEQINDAFSKLMYIFMHCKCEYDLNNGC